MPERRHSALHFKRHDGVPRRLHQHPPSKRFHGCGQSTLSKVLITGASGLLGGTLTLEARNRGWEVVAVYNTHAFHADGVTSVQADLADGGASERLVRRHRPDWIVHCAALTNVDWCEGHPDEAHRVNADVPRVLSRLACEVGARIVYISTDAVFDGATGDYSEEDAPAPVNVYATAKLAGETAVLEAHPAAAVVRTNIYGWNMQEKLSLAERILSRLEAGQTVPGFTDVFFSPMLADDLADVLLDLMDRRLSGPYHVVASEKCSKYDFAVRVAEVFGLDPSLVQPTPIDTVALSAQRPRDASLATGKMQKSLGRRMPDVRSGLLRFRAARDSGHAEKIKSCRGDEIDVQSANR